MCNVLNVKKKKLFKIELFIVLMSCVQNHLYTLTDTQFEQKQS